MAGARQTMNKLILLSFLVFALSAFAKTSEILEASARHPYSLLTPGYGVVTEDDLAYDNHFRRIGPYNPDTSLGEVYWQCFPAADVRVGFEAWVGHDGVESASDNSTMCIIDITVQSHGERQSYTDRRAHQIQFCLDFTDAWKRLTKNQKFACLNGEGGRWYKPDDKEDRYKLWTWEKFKTKKGCYAYFDVDCDTKGCDAGKGACRSKP